MDKIDIDRHNIGSKCSRYYFCYLPFTHPVLFDPRLIYQRKRYICIWTQLHPFSSLLTGLLNNILWFHYTVQYQYFLMLYCNK